MYYIDCYDDKPSVTFGNREEAIEAFKASLEPYKEWLDEISKDVHVSLYDEQYKNEFEPLYELCKHVNPKEIRRYMLYKNKLKGGNNSANSDIKNIILLIFMLLLITIFIISIVVVIIMKLNDNANNYTLKTF